MKFQREQTLVWSHDNLNPQERNYNKSWIKRKKRKLNRNSTCFSAFPLFPIIRLHSREIAGLSLDIPLCVEPFLFEPLKFIIKF